jgi:integrase
MAVVKERRGGRTLYRIQFRDGDKRRRSIRLAGVTRKDAEHIDSKVQALNATRISGRSLDTDLACWLASRSDSLLSKLADAGLCERRAKATLGAFVDEYIASRTEAASNTVRNWKNTRTKLTDYFGEERELRSITPGDADGWRQWLVDKHHSEATISKAVKHAKQFLKAAVRKRLADANPFHDLKAAGERDASRQAFITQETIAKVLDACPDAEWRLIVALARFGGLRTPSELLNLKWCDVDWPRQRFTVASAKTAERVVPIFPELRPFLEDADALAPEGREYVVNRYRGDNANLRTQLLRILRKAGVKPWPRLFHNLRASCQTELENRFPSHVVCRWLGNSEAVARKHYLQVTEEHYAQATSGGAGGGATGGANVVQQVVQQAPEAICSQPQETLKASGVKAGLPLFPEAFDCAQAPPRGVEPLSLD